MKHSFASCQTAGRAGFREVTVAAVILATAASGSPAYGQDEAEPQVLGTITVNARKVEEPVQRIPFGISVFDSNSIEEQDIRDTRSFSRKVPGLNFVDTSQRGSNVSNIRGVGSFFPQSSDDTSVPVFIDGVPLPVRAQDREFFDVERIEVLRGPQNTLYGRNAQAGAINITTADPTFEPLFEIGSEFGNFGSTRVTGLASGPITDNLAGRISVQFDHKDGDIRELNSGGVLRNQDLFNANGKVSWFPDDETDVTLAIRYGKYEEDNTGALFRAPDFPQVSFDTTPEYELETLGGGLTIRRDFEDFTLTSVTGLQYYDSDFFADDSDALISAARGVPSSIFNNPNLDFRFIHDEDVQVSQELRVDGELENGVLWVAGVNFFRSELFIDFTTNSLSFSNGEFNNRATSTSYAGFGEVTVPLTDRLRAIGGLRYTREIRGFDGQFTDFSGGTLGRDSNEDQDEAFNLVTGRAALTYDFLPTLTGFASFSRGAKAGGFQLVDFDARNGAETDDFDPAFTLTYEAGLRGTLLDGRLDLGASVFFNDTVDEHVQVFTPPSFEGVIENLDTETYGVELTAAVRPIEGLTLSGGLALVDTQITDTDDPTVAVGNEVPFAPEIAFDLAAQYEQPLDLFSFEGEAFGRAEYQYIGPRTIDPQNSFDLGSYDIVNLRAGWGSERVSVYGFVTNLLDENYAETAFGFGPGVFSATPGLPRRFGIGATVRF